MNVLGEPSDGEKKCPRDEFVQPGDKDIQVQLVISLALGISAFLAFCVCASSPRFSMALAAHLLL